MKMLKGILMFFALYVQHPVVFAQNKEPGVYPVIGKISPDFLLKDVKNYPRTNVSLADLKGKWTILDFWGVGCVACVKSFPKINELQKKYKDRLQFILVGLEDERIRPLYKAYQQKYDLDLSYMYDSALFRQYGIIGRGVPHVVWIDNNLIVRAVTANSNDLSNSNIQAFLDGKPFLFDDYSINGQTERENFYTYTKPLLIDGNGGDQSDFLFRSVLTATKPNTGNFAPPFIGVGETGKAENGSRYALIHANRVEATRMSLSMLYELAYGDTIQKIPIMDYGGAPAKNLAYAKFWKMPVLEIKDSSAFKTDEQTLRGYYNYSLVVPPDKATTTYVQKIMQRDLENYFGFDVKVETRKMPYWKIVTTDEGKKSLLSKGGKPFYEYSPASLKLVNRPMTDIVHMLWANNQEGPPFVDDTDIAGNIDLALEVELSKFDEVRKALFNKGIDLALGEKDMKVIVIRDGSNAPTASVEKYPVIGRASPDFKLPQVKYFSKNQLSLNDLRGKNVILDFFSLGCTSCFASFPKINGIQKDFRDRVQFVLVGLDNKARGDLLRKSYEKFREKFSLELPVAYDSAIFSDFKITGVPHVVWIDKDGIVQAVTSSVSKEQVQAFVEGRKFEFEDHSYEGSQKEEYTFDPKKPFLLNNNGGDDTSFIQRSIFSKWKKGMPVHAPIYAVIPIENEEKRRSEEPLQILGWPLMSLYKVAYFNRIADWPARDTVYYGKYYYAPVLELKDSSLFQFQWDNDQNKFCYSQVLPPGRATKKNMMEVMQRDLKNVFGYDVSVETRRMPVLKLIASEGARIRHKTKGGKRNETEYLGGLKYENVPVSLLIANISYNASLVAKGLTLIDESGITGNIDIAFEAAMTDWEDIRKALQTLGLNMVRGEKEMKVLVIRDPINLF